MNITKSQANQTLVLALEGRLDTLTSPQLEQEIAETSFDGIEVVKLDMNNLEYISSSGLRAVLSLNKKIQSVGGKLCLVNVRSSIMEVFNLTGMSKFLNIQQI